MTSSAGTTNAPDPAKREAFMREIAQHHDYSVEEMLGHLTIAEVVRVDQYHESATLAAIIQRPVPGSLIARNKEGALVLCNNTAMYDDDVEDLIESDKLIAQLSEKQKVAGTEEQAAAIRARRSTIAFLLHHGETTTAQPEAS